ncbi:hypothetical protein TNCV_2757241 [Trichonephila clavipes]|nr:hypothetical protein TNCV_2757241 [Trichonephila clavipes]
MKGSLVRHLNFNHKLPKRREFNCGVTPVVIESKKAFPTSLPRNPCGEFGHSCRRLLALSECDTVFNTKLGLLNHEKTH